MKITRNYKTERDDLDLLATQIGNCWDCELAELRNKAVPGVGLIDSPFILIGEAPGANENREGKPFIGSAGKILDWMLKQAGISRGDCFITNMVKCWPGEGNPDPTPEQIEACAPWLELQLDFIKPTGIITFGRFSTNKYIEFPKGRGIGSVQGTIRRLDNWNTPAFVMPIYHPAYLGRNRRELDNSIGHLKRFAELIDEVRRPF